MMNKTYRFKIDKLIRDKVPAIMRQSGMMVVARIMDDQEYLHRLKHKLLEEAQEVIDSHHEKEMCEELGDLLEVMQSIATAHGIKFSDILNVADQKRVERGGFEQRIYGAFVEIQNGHPKIGYYQARADRYPEI